MTHDMTVGKPSSIILKFSIPVIFGNLFQQIYSLVDTLIVGRTLGNNSLAAVGSTSVLVFFVLSFIQGMTNGFGILLGQRFGASDDEGVRKSVAASIILCILVSIAMTVPFTLLTKPILSFMNTPLDIFEEAYQYIIVIFLGIPIMIFYNIFSNILRAMGDSRTPLIFLCVASGLNIILDIVFIMNLNMGVAGAAWATVISQIVATVLCYIVMLIKFPILRLKLHEYRVSLHELKAHMAYGFPMGIQMSVMCIGLIAMQLEVNKLGSLCVAGFTAGSKVDQLAIQVNHAIGISIASYVAQNYGAGKMDRIKQGVKAATIQVVLFSIAIGVIILAFGRNMVMMFITDIQPEVVSYAMQFLWIMAPLYIIVGILILYRAAVQSMGNARAPFIACICELIMRIIGAVILSKYWGYVGICLATPLAWIGASIIVVIAYLRWYREA